MILSTEKANEVRKLWRRWSNEVQVLLVGEISNGEFTVSS